MSIAIISHADCVLHEMSDTHPEQPNRVTVVDDAIKGFKFKHPLQHYQAQPATEKQLRRVHPKHYIDWLPSVLPKDGYYAVDEDTRMNKHTLDAAYLSAGSLPQAVDLVMSGKHSAAFCNVRPPGHHAEKERAMGFCFFNNVAVGAMHAIEEYGLSRILIVDFDVHHGNGTQDIFQNDERILLCSSFEHPYYPGYDPNDDNQHILNVPLSAGTKGDVYRKKVAYAWFDKIDQFKPELVFFSAGFDAHEDDPLANLELTSEDYAWITTEIRELAEKHCGGRIISTLEGGYNLGVLAQCVPVHIDTLKG